MTRWIRWIIITVGAGLCISVQSQMAPLETIDSIDAKVLNSDTVATGTVVSPPAIAESKATVTIKVTDRLRGDRVSQISGVVRAPAYERPALYQPSDRVLVFVNNEPTSLTYIDLDHPALPISTADFKILKSPEEILRYVKALIRKQPKAPHCGRFVIPPPNTALGKSWSATVGRHGFGGLVVPIDPRLEKLGWTWLMRHDLKNLFRAAGALSNFKTDTNEARLKGLLKDPYFVVTLAAERFAGIELRDFVVRQVAAEVLDGWKVPHDPIETRVRYSRVATVKEVTTFTGLGDPDYGWLDQAKNLRKFTYLMGPITDDQLKAIGRQTKIEVLALNRAHLTDERLKLLLGMANLRSITLDHNPITNFGILLLSNFPKLKAVNVFGTQITSEGIEALHKVRPDITVTTTDLGN